MLLRKVELHNFRQFYGKQSVIFATDPGKNVTLIHAENGFGKTALLNSIYWALFEDVTSMFEDREKLVSFAALSEGESTASVDVDFIYNDAPYVVKRTFTHSTEKSRVTAASVSGGVHRMLNAPETFITSVVPREMAKYFFFDGESAVGFSSQTNYRAVGQAIRSILGCTLAETAISDLRELAKEYEKDIGAAADTKELERHQKDVVEKEERLEDLRDTLSEFETERDDREQQLAEVNEKLRNLKGARELQLAREAKEAELKAVEAELKSAKQDQLKWLGHRALHVVSGRLTKETLDFVDEASLRGKIPSPYNEDFVRGLLHSEMCICKRPLEPGSENYAAVADMLRDASTAETLGRVIRARSRVTSLQRDAVDAPQRLRELQTRVATRTTSRTRLEQEIGEFGKQLANLPIKEIAEREAAREALEKGIRKLGEEIGGAKVLALQLEAEVARGKKDTENIVRNNKKAGVVLRRRQMADTCRDVLGSLLTRYEEQARETIKANVDAILAEVAHRDYVCDLGDDFSLRLQMRSGHGVPKSGGEKQLLSLVFIGALIQYAASRMGDRSVILRPGTVAPLVLDAPLGQLDVEYQAAAARYLPTLAEQVVLLLSSSQSGPGIPEALESRVGAEYVLFSENVEPRGSRSESRLIIGGQEYVCSEFNRPRQMTRIERIR